MISDRMIRQNYLIPRDLYRSVKVTEPVGKDIKALRWAGMPVPEIIEVIKREGGPQLSRSAVYRCLSGRKYPEKRRGNRYERRTYVSSLDHKRMLFFRRKLMKKFVFRGVVGVEDMA